MKTAIAIVGCLAAAGPLAAPQAADGGTLTPTHQAYVRGKVAAIMKN